MSAKEDDKSKWDRDILGAPLPYHYLSKTDPVYPQDDVIAKGTKEEVKAIIGLERRTTYSSVSEDEMKKLAVFFPTEFALFRDFTISIIRHSPRPWQLTKRDVINVAKQKIIENRERFRRRFVHTLDHVLDQRIRCSDGELILSIESGYLCMFDPAEKKSIELVSGPKIPKKAPN